jgi:hypothetical protein
MLPRIAPQRENMVFIQPANGQYEIHILNIFPFGFTIQSYEESNVRFLDAIFKVNERTKPEYLLLLLQLCLRIGDYRSGVILSRILTLLCPA